MSNDAVRKVDEEISLDGYTNPAFVTPNGFVNLDEDVTGVKTLNAHNIIQQKETQPRSNYIDVVPEQSKEKQSFFSFGKKGNDEKHVLHMVSFLSLFRFADKYDYVFMAFGIISAMANGVALPVRMLVFGKITDVFVLAAKQDMNSTHNATNPDAFNDAFLDQVRTYSGYFSAIGILVIVGGYGQVMFWLTTSTRQANRMRHCLLRAILKQDIGWFDTHDAGELNSRLVDDVNKVQEALSNNVGAFFQYLSTFTVGLTIGLSLGWKLAVVTLAACPAIIIFGALAMKIITQSTEQESQAYAKAGAVAEEVLGSMRTVVAYGGQTKELDRYSKHLLNAKAIGIRKAMVSGAGQGMIFMVMYFTYALAFWYGGKLIRDEPQNYSVGVMILVFFSVVFGAQALGYAAPNLQCIAAARGTAYKLWDIIDKIPAIDSSSTEGLCPDGLTGVIELENVEFTYPSRQDVKILNGLTLHVRQGQTVAFVGSSGCGKSTVIQLLQRFYNPSAGTISIDGTNINEYNIKWLRQHIGVVSQEPKLFATTIAENIRYGREGVTQAEIEQATKESNAYDFISTLPLKFETLVGESGAQLSGGQKQRIAIARALVRDPRILLLDEATSALDTESEATVQAALHKAREGRTTIVVAHRLSTIRTADIIYGLKDGVVHEFGTHDELMMQSGIYNTLVTSQKMIEEEESSGSETESDEDIIIESSALKRTMSNNDRRRSSRRSLKRKASSAPSALETAAISKKLNEKKYPDVPLTRIMSLNSKEWYIIVIGCFMSLCHGGIQPIFGVIFGNIIGVFSEPIEQQAANILFYAMMCVLFGGGVAISLFFQGWMFGISGELLTMRMRQMAFKAYLRQEIGFFDNPDNPTGVLTTRLSTDASAVQGATGYRMGMMLQAMAGVMVSMIIGFIFSWKFAFFALGLMPFILMSAIVQIKLAKGYAGKNDEALEGAAKVATEAISNIRTIAALTKEDMYQKKFEEETLVPYKMNLKAAQFFGVTFCILQSMIYFTYAAIFYFGAWLIVHDGLYYPDMFIVFVSIIFGALSLGRESQFGPDYGKAKVAASRIFALFDRNPGTIDSYSTEGVEPTQCTGAVEFREVQFSYPTRSTVKVLKGLNLKVEQGKSIALVGSSGCGKSTTVQLLERFYESAEGQVCVDGNEIKSLNVAWLRAQMGLVSQEPILFDCSLRENIAYGDNNRTVEMAEIIEAAKKANIHNFIQSLPNGYETSAGDKGTQLSGGQKQRIAIARALLRNPKILLLDEATSALDTESEKVVQEALDRAREGRTSIVIAHRLSTIQNADCIVVFQHGRVAERGTHSELMSFKGLYFKLNLNQGHKK